MRDKLLHPATLLAAVAVLIAVAGSGYAISQLPRNSVGTAQLKNNAVTSAKVKDRSLLARDFKAGQLPRGERGPQGETGPATGAAGGALAGTYPNPTLASNALGTSRTFGIPENCAPFSDNPPTASTVFFTDNGWYSTSPGALNCGLGAIPARARITGVTARIVDTAATILTMGLGSRADDDPIITPAAQTASTGASGLQVLTLTAPANFVMDPTRSYVVYFQGTGITRTVISFTVSYTL